MTTYCFEATDRWICRTWGGRARIARAEADCERLVQMDTEPEEVDPDSPEAASALPYVDAAEPAPEHAEALPFDRSLTILAQVAEALDYAHGRGVAHHNLKPENILISSDDQVTVVDFGLARAVELSHASGMVRAAVGAPEYQAPEVIGGLGGGPSADLYALGVLAYELLTGAVPFGGGSA